MNNAHHHLFNEVKVPPGFTVQDDQLHPAGENASPLYRESFFWGFHEPAGIWGMANIALHYNVPRTDRFLVLALPDGRLLTHGQIDSAPIQEASLTANAVQFIRLEPLVRWRIQAEATFTMVPQRQDISRVLLPIHTLPLTTLFRPLDEPPETVPVHLDLIYTTITGPQPVDWSFFGVPARHYQAVGQMLGTIQVADQFYHFAGHGPHDHSWGIRDWLLPREWYFGSFQMGATSIHLVRSQTTDGRSIESGFIHRDGITETICAVHVQADHDPDNAHVRSARITLATASGATLTLEVSARDHYHFTVHVQDNQLCHDTETLVAVRGPAGQGQGILQYGHLIVNHRT